MTYGSRVFLVSHPQYYGIIVGFTDMDVLVEWDDAPGQFAAVNPFDIDEIDIPFPADFIYVSDKKKKLNEILGV